MASSVAAGGTTDGDAAQTVDRAVSASSRSLPRHRADYTLPRLLDLLRSARLLTTEQSRTVSERQDAMREEIATRKGNGLAAASVSPIELVAAFQFEIEGHAGGTVDEAQIARGLAQLAGVSVARIDRSKLQPDEIVETLTPNEARSHNAIPIEFDSDRVVVATDFPWNEQLIISLRKKRGLDVVLAVAPASQVEALIEELLPRSIPRARPGSEAGADLGGSPLAPDEANGPASDASSQPPKTAEARIAAIFQAARMESSSRLHRYVVGAVLVAGLLVLAAYCHRQFAPGLLKLTNASADESTLDDAAQQRLRSGTGPPDGG